MENVHAVTCDSDEYCADTDPTSGECERCAKIGGSDDIEGLSNKPIDEVLVDVIGVLAAIFGGIFILMMLAGAMMMMFGETANMKETGKTTIQWAVVGGVVGLLTGVIWLVLRGTFS